MKISVFDIIQSELAVNQEDGVKLFESLKSVNISDLSISFEGVHLMSTLFLNESIGRMAMIYGEDINKIKFHYPENKPLFSAKVEDVIENALMGDDYDSLVDKASASI